jgi:hypothetical protein
MKKGALILILCFLDFAIVGCLFSPSNWFGDNRWDNQNWGPVYARLELSCVKCATDETVEVRLRYGISLETIESESLFIVLETDGFDLEGPSETLVESLDDSYAMTSENSRYVLPKSIDFTIELANSGFQYGVIRAVFYQNAEKTEPMKTVQIGFANDEQGLIFDRTTEYAMKTSLRRLYNSGVIDRAEFVRRDAAWYLDGSLAMPSTTRNAVSIAIEYHSSQIRVKRIIPIDDPLAVLYLEVEAMYDEIWEREHMFRPEWMKEEFQELAQAYVAYLYEHEWIDLETRDRELEAIPYMQVYLGFLGSLSISSDRFGHDCWNDFYTIP